MKFILDRYDAIKLAILIGLVASLPYYLFISSVLLILGVVLSLVKVFSKNRDQPFRSDRLTLFFVAYFLLEVVGLSYTESENLGLGSFTLEKHLALLFVPFIFSDFRISTRHRNLLFLAFVISCFAGAVICVVANFYLSLAEYNTWMHEWRFSHGRLAEPIGMHQVYFAMYLSLAVLILLDWIKEKGSNFSTLKKAGIVFVILFFLLMIISLGARTIIVALLGIIIVTIVRYAIVHKSYRVFGWAVLTLFVFVGMISLNPVVTTRFKDMMKSQYEGSNYGSYFARTKIWEPGIEIIRENPWFGVGTGDHQSELNKRYLKYGYQEGIEENMNMHSQYLQTLLNFGVIGLILFLGILGLELRDGFLKKDWLYLGFLGLFMSGCLTESMLSVNKGVIFFLLFSFIFYRSEDPLFTPQ